MRFQHATAILALLPLALSEPFNLSLKSPTSAQLNARATEPADTIPLPALPEQPFFRITSFDAFLPSAEAASNPRTGYSRTRFDLHLQDPNAAQNWTTTCFVHTLSALCGPRVWNECEKVHGEANTNETISFRFDKDVSGIEIQRVWEHEGRMLMVYAEEPATWLKKRRVGDARGNLTVTALGRWFQKKDAWDLPWKGAVA